MKAGLDKNQLLAVVGGAVVVLGAGGAAWFGLGGLG